MKRVLILLACLAAAPSLFAQTPDKEAQKREKEFYDTVQKEVDSHASALDLAAWQVFKVDSTLMHDYTARRDELEEISRAKVSNPDLYQRVIDKWAERTYEAFHKFLNEEQWAKYLKRGAAREKKARDKRMSKYSE